MKLNEKIKKYYNKSQLFYDWFWMNKKNLGMHYGFWERGTKSLHEAILNENKTVAEELNLKKSDIVLDAGCGVGGTAIWLAENYGVRVTGINISKEQIKLAKKYAKKRKVEHLVNFEVRDFCDTGFPDNSFTKIFGIESICHSEKKEDFLKEAYRILKPNGKLVIADGFLKKKRLNKEEQILYNECLEGWAVPNLAWPNDFYKKLENIGFKNIKFLDKTKEIWPSSKKMFIVVGLVLYPILRALNLLRIVSDIGLYHAKVGFNQYYIFKKQIGMYGLFSAHKL